MSTVTLRINGKAVSADVDPNTPLLWVLRDSLGLVGTHGLDVSTDASR